MHTYITHRHTTIYIYIHVHNNFCSCTFTHTHTKSLPVRRWCPKSTPTRRRTWSAGSVWFRIGPLRRRILDVFGGLFKGSNHPKLIQILIISLIWDVFWIFFWRHTIPSNLSRSWCFFHRKPSGFIMFQTLETQLLDMTWQTWPLLGGKLAQWI